jgi:putative ABC transport system permease protein
MTLKISFAIAAKALSKNKLQTALTMIGLTMGVATVLTMIALGTGAQAAIQDQVKAAGMNTIIITAGNYKVKTADEQDAIEESSAAFIPQPNSNFRFRTAVFSPADAPQFTRVFHPEDDPFAVHDHPTAAQRLGDAEAGLGSAATLTSADANAIRKLSGVQFVSEGVHENAHVTYKDKRWFTRLHGDDVSLPNIRRAWKTERGRFYTSSEESSAEEVVVLGSIAAQKLFGTQNPLGETIALWKQPFKVVGVIGSSSWIVAPAVGDDQFDAIYVPFTTVHRLLNLTKLNDITVTSASAGDVGRLVKKITTLLRQRHNIGDRKPDDFSVTSQARQALAKGGLRPQVAKSVVSNMDTFEKVTLEQLGKTLDRASRTMTALLASVAAVSLLVGGIGIMNIMLLSVTERTREIGVRRAVGARSKDVLVQFLIEATTLSALGGVAGIALGILASLAISKWASWSASISLISVLLSFGVAASVGIFFGFYPARQASEVAPIECLRFE